MVRPDRERLGGPGTVVDLDETLIGDVSGGTIGGDADKVPMMIAVELDPSATTHESSSGNHLSSCWYIAG